jgi:hypothetical protein
MTDCPAFLQQPHENGKTIKAAFSLLPFEQQREVDQWLVVNSVYGSLTWQEQLLLAAIEDGLFLDF